MRPLTSKVNAMLAVASIILVACGSGASSPAAPAVTASSAPSVVATVPPPSVAVTEAPPSASAGEATNAPAASSSAPSAAPSAVASAAPGASSGSTAAVTAIGAGLGAAGQEFACAVLAGGGVKCWGDNTYGALGDGSASAPQNASEASSATPVAVTGLDSGVTAIAVGQSAACAITADGGVMCWGDNVAGELGNGTTMDAATMTNIYSAVPVKVAGLTGVTAIAHGQSFACALTAGGGVKCWGDNTTYGELGNGSATSGTRSFSPTPVNVKGLSSGVTAITAGLDFACALTAAGGVKCWGDGGGIFNIGNFANSTIPFAVADPALRAGVKAISAGGAFLCALTAAGGVKCLGGDRYGQIGSGSIAPKPGVSADVSGLTSGVTAISAGGQFACALTTAGGAKCWGDGYGFSCSSPTACQSVPVDVPSLASGVTALAAGWSQACAITTANGVECWGAGSGTGVSTPAVVPGL
ncbi:MAG: RCC1 domain-containing protein [Candidatus Limnocylindrales bacterium]